MMLQNMMLLGGYAKMKLREFFSDERGAVNILEIVILIGIVVLLALVFKEKLQELLESLFATIIPSAKNAVSGTTGD